MRALARRYGSGVLNDTISALMDYTARHTRQELARLPDGVYSAEGCIDDDGINPGKPVKFAVDVTIRGESITFDFTRSDPQMPGGMNIPQSSVRSAVQYAFTCLLPSDIPVNEGVMTPVSIVAPEGSSVNPRFPAAVGDRHIACERLCDVLVKAMAAIAPERASASWCVGFPVFICESKSPKTGDGAVLLAIIAGGAGGAAEHDGASGIDVHLSNCAIIPAEIVESNYELRIERYELIQDSAGAGRQRGGFGIRADYRNMSGRAMPVQTEIEQSNPSFPPSGVDGGMDGSVCSAFLITSEGETPLPSKGFYSMPADSVVSLRGGGGGGYGNPLERAPQDVMTDVAAGFVSAEAASRLYGVDPSTGRRDAGVGAAA